MVRKKPPDGTICSDTVNELAGALARLPHFRRFPSHILDKISTFTIMVPIYAGQTIHEEGDPGTDLVFLAEGEARVQVESIYPMLEVGIHRARAGELLGEAPLLTGGSHSATIVCKESGAILRVRVEKLRRLFEREPIWGFYFMEELARSLAAKNSRLARRLVNRVRLGHQ